MRWFQALVVALTAFCVTACGSPAKGPPPGQSAGCTLPRSGHASLDEWGSCVQVTATLSKPPAVGEEAVLTVEVLSLQDRQLRVELDLPRSFAWAVVPPGMTQTSSPDPAPDNGGCVRRAAGSLAVAGAQPSRLTGTVKALDPGFATLRARAIAAVSPGEGTGTSTDSVFVTVGHTSETSFFGYRPDSGAAQTTPTGAAPRC